MRLTTSRLWIAIANPILLRVHELAIVQSVIDAVCARVGARRVARVHVRVGALVAVAPDALRFCFDVVSRETALERALLELEEVAARGACRSCRAVFELADGLPLCACGSADVDIVAGRELSIQQVELV